MKLSMATSALNIYINNGTSRKVAFEALRNAGFTCVDYGITDSMLGDTLEKCAEEEKAMLAGLGLTPSQGHAPMYNPLNPPAHIDCVDLYDRALRYCQLVGIPQVVIHPGALEGNTREEFFEKNIAFYRSLIPSAEKYNVRILIENIGNYADPYYLWSGADLREMIDRVDHPLFFACWDVGHANHFWPEDNCQYESIVALGDKLAALHIHDNGGYFTEPRDHHRIDMHTLPFFSSASPLSFDAVLQGLKDVGYQGTFNFETIFPAVRPRTRFYYHGKDHSLLTCLPLSLWEKFNAVVYDMGRYMLETYGLFEQ